MEILIKVFQFILSLSLIIVLHEFGHYLPAKYFKIKVEKFDNLLVHYVKSKNASLIIRGLRAVSDFEYEFLMTGMNRTIDKEIETIFLMSSEKYHFISSRFIKEIHKLGGDISKSVPKPVLDFLSKI